MSSLQDERVELMSVISQAMHETGAFTLGGPIPPGVYAEIADAVLAAGWRRDAEDGFGPSVLPEEKP
jgi:hypothetical protein